MPWHVVPDHADCGDGKFAVVKEGGEVVSCHPTRDDADEHVAALYANTDEDGHGMGNGYRAQMTAATINDLPDSAFAYIEPGGTKDEHGRTTPRSLRHFPIHDAAHVRNALARAPQSPFGDKAMPKIRRAARKFGIAVADNGRARTLPAVCVRAFDFELRSTGRDGRILEGYVAVFGATARITDLQGDFDEEIHRGAFDRSLARSLPVMQFDHGRDPRTGTVPIGVYDTFEPDERGYYVRGPLFDNPVVEPIRQAIKGKAIKGMSWRMLVPKEGQRWSRRTGYVDKRDVIDADVPEAGPVVFPAYDATSVSMRSLLAAMNPDEIRELVHELHQHLGRAIDLDVRANESGDADSIDLTGRPTRGVGGGDRETPASQRGVPHLSPDPRTRDRVLRAIGVLRE